MPGIMEEIEGVAFFLPPGSPLVLGGLSPRPRVSKLCGRHLNMTTRELNPDLSTPAHARQDVYSGQRNLAETSPKENNRQAIRPSIPSPSKGFRFPVDAALPHISDASSMPHNVPSPNSATTSAPLQAQNHTPQFRSGAHPARPMRPTRLWTSVPAKLSAGSTLRPVLQPSALRGRPASCKIRMSDPGHPPCLLIQLTPASTDGRSAGPTTGRQGRLFLRPAIGVIAAIPMRRRPQRKCARRPCRPQGAPELRIATIAVAVAGVAIAVVKPVPRRSSPSLAITTGRRPSAVPGVPRCSFARGRSPRPRASPPSRAGSGSGDPRESRQARKRPARPASAARRAAPSGLRLRRALRAA